MKDSSKRKTATKKALVEKAPAKKMQLKNPVKKAPAKKETALPSAPSWTFLTNHSHVLICLAREPELRLRDVSERVGITERAVQRIVADLEEAEILTRSRDGRRNRYEVHAGRPLRHPVEGHCTVNDLLKIVAAD